MPNLNTLGTPSIGFVTKQERMNWSDMHKTCVQLLEESDYDRVDTVLERAFELYGDESLNDVTESGATALHFAALSEYPHMLDLLVLNGADVNATNDNNETPLHWACSAGHVVSVELLLSHGAIQQKDKNGDTPLHWAIDGGNHPVAKYLLQHKK